jgi:hypothetical protein
MPALTLDDIGRFTWSFGRYFHIETNKGNFIWSDPDYGGDNTIRHTDMNYMQWRQYLQLPFGRDKGEHIIRDYCGIDVKMV